MFGFILNEKKGIFDQFRLVSGPSPVHQTKPPQFRGGRVGPTPPLPCWEGGPGPPQGFPSIPGRPEPEPEAHPRKAGSATRQLSSRAGPTRAGQGPPRRRSARAALCSGSGLPACRRPHAAMQCRCHGPDPPASIGRHLCPTPIITMSRCHDHPGSPNPRRGTGHHPSGCRAAAFLADRGPASTDALSPLLSVISFCVC